MGVREGRLINWYYTVANITLGTDPNAPLAYDMGLELHHPILSTSGAHRGQLVRWRDILNNKEILNGLKGSTKIQKR